MQLRSYYQPPGRVLLARAADGAAIGVVALLVTGSTGEIRRLFVQPGSRTGGIGRRLIGELLTYATSLGLERVVLNTLPTMVHAQHLYRTFGFAETAPYVINPTDGVLYFALDLTLPSSREPLPTSRTPSD